MQKVLATFSFLSLGLLGLYSCGSSPNKHSLEKKWETDSLLKVPESVLFDGQAKLLYVSNVDGMDTWAKDGKGEISQVGLDGKIIRQDWITGLNSPKGLGIYNGKLYAADVTEIDVIDVAGDSVVNRIPVPGSVGLNDLTITGDGTIYVSDSEGKKLFRVKNGVAELVADQLNHINGVLAHGNDLYVLAEGNLNKLSADNKLIKVAGRLQGGPDGVESIAGTDFIVSGWDGVIYYVYGDGKKEKLLDTRSEKKNSADIGFDEATRTVYVPTFWKNSVVAYTVK